MVVLEDMDLTVVVVQEMTLCLLEEEVVLANLDTRVHLVLLTLVLIGTLMVRVVMENNSHHLLGI
jgi:hypothetical protein